MLPRIVQGCFVLPDTLEGGEQYCVLNQWRFFYLKGPSNFPKFTKIIRKRARFEKKPTCPFPKLVHPLIFYFVGISHFSELFSLRPWCRNDGIFFVLLWLLNTILYTMMSNTVLDAWSESDKCQWMNEWMNQPNESCCVPTLVFSTKLHSHSSPGLSSGISPHTNAGVDKLWPIGQIQSDA